MASLLDLAQARLGGLLAPQRPSMAGLLGGQRTQGNLASALQGYTPPQMTAMTNPQVMDYARNVAQTAQQNLQTQMSDLDKALVMDQGGINVGDRQALARLIEQVPGLMGATAYHGTPHTIRGKFDISKVGTGEGAQAYGHGMYFAENPNVAIQYKNILSKPEFTKTGEGIELRGQLPRMLDESYSELVAKNGIQQTNYGDVTDIVGQRLDRQMKDALKANDMDWYNKTADMKLDLARFKENPPSNVGNLYKVDIPDEYIPKMVQFETPLSEMDEKLASVIKPLQEQLKNQPNPDLFKNAKSVGDVIQYSNAIGLNPHIPLQEAGYKGIRYLDEGSRVAGKGTSNYVVFDPTDVKILEKNSQKVEGLLD
jgi:hypothetical protein